MICYVVSSDEECCLDDAGMMSRNEGLAQSCEFDAFVRENATWLTRTARLLTAGSTGADAEDLAQEALIIMYRKWPTLRRRGAERAYVYKTLLRLSRRLAVRRSRESPFPDSGIERASPSQEGLDDRLQNALVRLPARQRETLVLRYLADLSVDQVSQVMKCSRSTVKSQTRMALDFMRRELPSPDQDTGEMGRNADR